MTEPKGGTTRREFLKDTGRIAAATSALAGVAIPSVHAGENNTIKVALIGCGGRGTGAAANALSVQQGPIKLVAMADVFQDKLDRAHDQLKKEFADSSKPNTLDVPDDRKFVGFDAYKKAMECLEPGDVAIMATPPAFRWVQFGEAIARNLNVFMEKPITVDGPSTRRMLALGEDSVKKNLKVGVGLMCRHCAARGELYDRIKNGEIGDILTLRAYRQTGPVGTAFTGPKPDGISELMYQIQRFHGFLWASGGCYSDFLIHNIEECCWMKDAWPVSAKGSGARTYREDNIDQNFDTYSVEYTFADGTKFFLEGRNITGCDQEFASYAHGSKGSAVISTSGHSPAKCRIYKGQKITRKDLVWSAPQPEANPYQLEWDHLIDAIRNDKPYNEVKRGAEASLVTSMGRMACHTGQVITFDDMLNCEHEFAPYVDQLTVDSPAPLQKGPNGLYPMPQPGIVRNREFETPAKA
ncbi:Gfo/Idh/MocA family protein [Singulisphaera acidiphila]|uniref:Putative dehydrogenase n=1 Tax=Singulisphaera acidiphila (strain ATCC BAA-1392 / DSM 18658 / VKM B-2454 / MOB10) TaxID=886293 RepID=L0DQ61_SINAD|nr:Gfo/Idh/MocA family oxidoreductase [Singulisphaera acidiphila]AGA30993.1 putative dehydrogenase [Singulisphaera acidiphila DSM 18658]